MRKKRLALLMGEADEGRQSRFVTGFLSQAFSADADVCVFSMYRKYQNTEVREKGDSNIFELFDPGFFDAVAILKDSIQTPGTANKIEERLHAAFKGPVLSVDRESDYFPSVKQDDTEGMRIITEHMIEVHGYKDIGFISGKKWHEHAIKRVETFMKTMEDHGLKVDEDLIYHGDFWFTSGELAYREFTSEGRSLPKAVICANDEMAIGLCDALTKHGIRVPEDVAVAGYDSNFEGRTSPKAITSVVIPMEELGSYAAKFLTDKLEGREPGPYEGKPYLFAGDSCGCPAPDIPERHGERSKWPTDRMLEGMWNVNNMMSENLLAQNDLQGFLGTLYSYAYQLREADEFVLCLSEPWAAIDIEPQIHLENSGYHDKTLMALRYRGMMSGEYVGLSEAFDTKELLPKLFEGNSEPSAYFFTPFFCEDECFGYAAVSYGNCPRSIDEDYRTWVEAAARGFESLRRNLEIKKLMEGLNPIRENKFAYSGGRNELTDEEKADYDLVGKILDDNLLTYYFQPIVSAKDGEIVSFEALMRTTTERTISPLDIIKYADMQGRLSDVERLTFLNVLNIYDSRKEDFGKAKVFINSLPGVKLAKEDFNSFSFLLSKYGDHTVVELTEDSELGDDDLQSFKERYQSLGIQFAIDDYGKGYSNVSNLLRYIPNCVKIDRELLSGIDENTRKKHFVNEIINFCSDNGIMSLAEGVETREELRTLIRMGVDLIQGYYTGRPSPEVIPSIDPNVKNDIINFNKEKENGFDRKIYRAGSTNRVSLGLLMKSECTDIVVGIEEALYQDITIVGAPNLMTGLSLRVLPGYSGTVTLENIFFEADKGHPCIDLGDGSDVTFRLKGRNILKGLGIRVPKSARAVFEGEGSLQVDTNDPKYYCIGNDLESAHGEMVFMQDGAISLNGAGQDGVCIGSGLGGVIKINRGQYFIKSSGILSIGIGAMHESEKIMIDTCSMDIDVKASKTVLIGGMEEFSGVNISKSSLRFSSSGAVSVGIGTINGKDADLELYDSGINIDLCSEQSTCLGSLEGDSFLAVDHVSLELHNVGKRALLMGGYTGKTKIVLSEADMRGEIHTGLGKDTFADDDDIVITNGRVSFMVNDEVIKRKQRFII